MNDVSKIMFIVGRCNEIDLSCKSWIYYTTREMQEINEIATSNKENVDVYDEIYKIVTSEDFVNKLTDLQQKINETKELVDAYVDEIGG